ncbi:MAG TPA: hypothetical protein VN705_05770 [Steroidobacteraceae bacterium]|jgi:hypothetical protein|nr:hypothetical protein [Steroidobacteraceae bacterium]
MNFPHLHLLRSAALGALASLLAACGGGGGGGGGTPAPATVTISGRITFDRIGFDATLGNGLNPTAPVELPARQVTVQAIDASNTSVLAETVTDTLGDYSLSVPSNRNLFIRARAEMIRTGTAPTWNFSVRNNTTAGTGDALYALDGNAASSGAANSTRNLRAPTGFGVNSYTGERAAAPFAILDTVFRAKELVLTAAPTTAFPDLRMFWSSSNKPNVGNFCPDDGNINTSSYVVFGAGEVDGCGDPVATGIYLLGDFTTGDTDEFDQSVIAHEFGHYVEDRFGRSDSIGGEHGGSATPLDLRVAFGEGWGNAFSGMVRNDPIYRDSFNGAQDDFNIDLEADDDVNEGWFSEASVWEILWDLFDATNEAGDTAALGFAPLYAVMTGAEKTTDAVTSIFTFITGLEAANPTAMAAINDLVAGEDINGTGDFGTGETNDGNPAINNGVLPVYGDITFNDPPITVCSRSPFGNTSGNKLGNRVFLRFNNTAQHLVTIQVTGSNGGGGVPATDPDIFVLRRGVLAAFGANEVPGSETIDQVPLPDGLYIIEVYDFAIDGASNIPRCMTVSVTGT